MVTNPPITTNIKFKTVFLLVHLCYQLHKCISLTFILTFSLPQFQQGNGNVKTMLKSIHLCNWSYKCTNSNTVLNLTFVMIGGLVTVCYNAFFSLDSASGLIWTIPFFGYFQFMLGHFGPFLGNFGNFLPFIGKSPHPTYFSLFSSIFQYYIFYPTFREIN